MSLCIPPFCYGASSVGGSVSKSKAKGDFASVTEQSGIKAGDGGFQINVTGNTDLQAGEIQVRMHPLSIKRAVANMVVNAARYGNGWIKVSSGSELNHAWFQVEDDGPGIKPEQRKHLFQPFVRGDSARSTSGTGLGLAIVQRIIDNHNGLLEIGTSERGGLSIRAWLPVPVTRGQVKEG